MPGRYVLFEGATISVRIARLRVVAVEAADPRHRTLSAKFAERLHACL